MVSFLPRPLNPRGESSWYSLDRRLGRLQSRSVPYGEEQHFNTLRNGNSTFRPVAHRYIDWAITACRLLIHILNLGTIRILHFLPRLLVSWLYRVSQNEWSIFQEVIVSVILSMKLYMYMCPGPNGFRDTAISLYSSKTVHCKDEQHAMSSHELQSEFMLTVEFLKMYYAR
jgi:hypothetical protein